MENKKYYTADRETGTIIDEFDTYAEAEKAIAEYEAQDKDDGTYEEGFYDIVNEDHCSIDEDGFTYEEKYIMGEVEM